MVYKAKLTLNNCLLYNIFKSHSARNIIGMTEYKLFFIIDINVSCILFDKVGLNTIVSPLNVKEIWLYDKMLIRIFIFMQKQVVSCSIRFCSIEQKIQQ